MKLRKEHQDGTSSSARPMIQDGNEIYDVDAGHIDNEVSHQSYVD